MTEQTQSSPVSPLSALPDELLEAIVLYLPPNATIAFGSTCSRNNKVTFEPLVWRRHCVQRWRYWEPRHEVDEKLAAPPSQTKWRLLYNDRRRIDREVLELFDAMLLTQQHRCQRMEKIAAFGYDAKDSMLALRDKTPDDADDVLARRYHADAIIGQIHRATAVEKWSRLKNKRMVRLEDVLGSFDLFVLSGERGDLGDVDRELGRLARCIRDRNEDWDEFSTRKKAIQIVKYLRSEGLVGNPDVGDYHALRNNFITMALFDEVHTSLPLQSVAIFCGVARRLGINAKPANFPEHVFAVIEPPQDQSLDGRPRSSDVDEAPERMFMDPWRHSDETPLQDLQLRLMQMGAPSHLHAHHLGPAPTLEIAIRTGRNIMRSVQEVRERQQASTNISSDPDVEAAWYSMLWAMLVLGDSNAASTLHRRRQCLPYLIEHFQAHFPEDLGLIESQILPMFESEREHHVLMHIIETARAADRNKKAPSPRNASTSVVNYKIGHHFVHRRFEYQGIIVGWDIKCGAQPRWIEQMRVDELPRGREQPFYNVVYDSQNPRSTGHVFYTALCSSADHERRADDKSVRYVAEENINVSSEQPCEALMRLAGRYFKRWDAKAGLFVSNIVDEYPDD